MSLITLLDTKDIVKDCITAIVENFDNKESISFVKDPNILTKELINIYKLQYNLIFTYYNKSTAKKVGHSSETNNTLGKNRVLEYYYQHQFLHNTSAIVDEVFEQYDALNSLACKKSDQDKTYREFLLFLEESIDIVHFAVEYGCLFAEHAVMLDKDIKDFPKCIYEDINFKNEVIEQISRWTDGMNLEKNVSPNIASKLTDNYADHALYVMKNVRKLIRNFAFKDWKIYPEDYYTKEKLEDLFKLSQNVIASVYNIILYVSLSNADLFCRYVEEVFGTHRDIIREQLNNPDNYILIYHLAYGCYVAKNYVNARRQIDDPRYTMKDFGTIIGVEV